MADKFTILFQGDSITDCGRATCGGAGYNNNGLGPGYAGMIASRLLCDRPDVDWTFYNRGISGNRIVDLYARWKIDGLNLKPDLISILIGVNDTWHTYGSNNGVEVDRAERIYRELLQWTKQVLPDVKLVLMEPFYFDVNTFPQEGVEDVAKRGAFTKKLAEEFGAVFLPCQSILNEKLKLAEPKYWLWDGVHPTPAGQQVLTDAWLEAAKDLLP
jgi:lysophospholipase L1-like esterase